MHTQSLKDLLFIPQIHLPLLESPTGLVERLFEESFEAFFRSRLDLLSPFPFKATMLMCAFMGTLALSQLNGEKLFYILLFLF